MRASPAVVSSLVWACLATLGEATPQDGPVDLSERFETLGGVAVTLWAESPLLFNPTAMDIDEHGRVWVTEGVNYRRWGGRNPGREHPEGDRIVVLQDTDGDGAADTSTVFAQDVDLVSPLGICVLGSRVIVSCSPSIFVYHDDDGDLVADRRETLLTGFGGRDHDHGVHSVVFGPDGRLLFNAGNAGPHIVTDKDGWTLRAGSLYSGGGPEAADNRPGLVSDDGRVWVGGIVLEMEPDGSGLEVIAHNFRNPYEVAVDSFGRRWLTDNDDDGNASCRAVWVMPNGNYGYTSADGSRSWQADRRPGQDTVRAHWHQDDPGVVPTTAVTGAGGPTGVAAYEGKLVPLAKGAVLGADAGRSLIFALKPGERGAGWELSQDVLIRSVPFERDDTTQRDETPHLFRPSDVTVAPDGAIFVADWYDPGVGGHLAGDQEAYGRILRVAPRVQQAPPPTLDLDTTAGRIAALKSPNHAVRFRAWQAIDATVLRDGDADSSGDPLLVAERTALAAETDAALTAMYARGDPIHRARAAWLLARRGAEGLRSVRSGLLDRNPLMRLVSARAMRAAGVPAAVMGRALVRDGSPAVRREAALMLRDAPASERATLFPLFLSAFPEDDRVFLEALGVAYEDMGDYVYEYLARSLSGSGSHWSRSVADLAWRFHPEEAVPAWAARLDAPELGLDAREQALTALAFSAGRPPADAVLNAALAGPEDLRPLATWWIEHHDVGPWAEYDLARHVASAAWDDAELRFDSGPLRSGGVPVAVDISGARRLGLVVTESDNGNGHDWADWLQPRLVGPAGELSLTDLEWTRAEAAWGSVRVGNDCIGGPLQVDGTTYTDGIGTHAHSEIVYDLPEGYVRFVAIAALDDGGSGQPGARSEVVFRVYADAPQDTGRLDDLKAAVRDPMADDARDDALEALAIDPEGGAWLIAEAQADRLDADGRELVAESIFRNPDFGVRALAGSVFERPGRRGPPLPPLDELTALSGDVRRGRLLYGRTDTACITCHAFDGRGGDIGPELTGIRSKLGRRELLDAMLHPSAAISAGYEAHMLETVDGRVLTGFILVDGQRVVIKDSMGERHVLEADEISSRRRLELSLMPDDVALGLSAQDLADLASFLLEDRDVDPDYGEWVDLLGSGTLDGWVAFHPTGDLGAAGATHVANGSWKSAPGGTSIGSAWTLSDGMLATPGQPIGYIRTEARYRDFELRLQWRFPAGSDPGNSGVLLRLIGEDEVWPRSIEAQLMHRNAGDIWNIGEFDMLTDHARTDGRRTVKLAPTKENPVGGWNDYLIRLDGPDLELRVNGRLQNEARWCAELPGYIALQAEGAPIEFRNVRLRAIER